MPNTSQESELRLLIGMLEDFVSKPAQASPIPPNIDWNTLLPLARLHRIVPLLFHGIGTNPTVPEQVRETLRLESRFLITRNLTLACELSNLTKCFEAGGIRVLPLKGPVLAQTLYGNLGLRSFGDLDILVPPAQLQEAATLLQSQGYHCEFDWPAWRQRAYAVSSGHHYRFIHIERQIALELHWRISPGKLAFPIENRAFWERLKTTCVIGSNIPSSPLEDLLIILCIHGARHWWSRLNLITDIALLVGRSHQIDYHEVRRRAKAAGALRTLHLGLFMAHQVLGVPLPSAMEAEVRSDRAAGALAKESRSMLALQTDLEVEYWKRWRYYLALRERLLDRLIYIGGQGINSVFWRNTTRVMQDGSKTPDSPAPSHLEASSV